MAEALDDFTERSFTHDGTTHLVFGAGTGPAVIVIHEMPGITPAVADFARRVRDAGFSVRMPSLFGEPGRPMSPGYVVKSLSQGCVAKEFVTLALDRTSPAIGWLRALAADAHQECGGPGVGAVGMCFTGGFALAMMVDDRMVAPVVSQPSLPLPVGKGRAADLGLSPADVERVQDRAAGGCDVLGLRYTDDAAVGTRFDSLRKLLGDRFIAVEFPGKGHSVLTEHLQEEGVERVIDFLTTRLLPPSS
jgi:dienelactone hydrolase